MIDANESHSSAETLSLSGPPLPVNSEFVAKPVTGQFDKCGLKLGRCFGSKSGYQKRNPKCDFIPNANVFSRRNGKVWFGDLDLVCDAPALERIARRIRCHLYVLRENEGRFYRAKRQFDEIVRSAVWRTGGAISIPGSRRFFLRSGLSRSDATILLKLSCGRFDNPQPPKIALDIGRRLRKFEDMFGAIALDEGYRQWGLWWTLPRTKLAGKSALQVLMSGETLDLGKLTPSTIGLSFFAITYGAMEKI